MKPTLIGLLLLVASISMIAPTAAQTNTTVTLQEANQDDAVCKSIDDDTRLCQSSLDGTTATLIIESDVRQSVTLTDAAGWTLGGTVRRETRLLTDGENRVDFEVTRHRGLAGLTIDTGSTLFGVPLEEPTVLLSPPITRADVQAGALGGASAVAFSFLVLILRSASGDDDEPEWVA